MAAVPELAEQPDALVLDALVIGAGPAGLACALYLARFRRRVLVVDAGGSRASKIPCTRNYPGFAKGVAGADLLAAMREQAERHGVRFVAGEVDSLHRHEYFEAQWNGGVARARKVVLATGVSDVPPPMPHLTQALNEGALRYCPVCDGYEVIDRHVGLIADEGNDTFEALYLRHFSHAVSVFIVADRVRFTEAQQRQMLAAGITLVPEPVERIRLDGTRVAVRHGQQETVVDSLYAALGMRIHSGLATALGAAQEEGYLLTDHRQQTTVDGLYAAGDVTKGLNQIAVATGHAAVAASAIHLALMGRG